MGQKTWLGSSMDMLYDENGPFSFSVQPISPSRHHTVLYELPVKLDAPKPHRNAHNHDWDENHVKMPYSPKNLFPSENENGEKILQSRWTIIKEAYSKPIKSSRELEAAITSYNTKLPIFDALHYFFEELMDENEGVIFFQNILPKIVQLALKLPELVPACIPLLKQGSCHSLSFSQLQIACLLANGFLCTFPWRKDVCNTYPGLNFVRLFAANSRPKRQNCVAEKLKCIFHYFRRVLSKTPCGVVTYERKFLRRNQVPRWDKLDNNLGNTKVHISSVGTIEDNGVGLLQVDFANRFVGGGVLSYGCVQEEIRYIICPELIVSRLFTEELGSTEALVITGAERYSNYTGYGDTFMWNGNHKDETPFDAYSRRKTNVIAIDAIKFNKPSDQFNSSMILRELNKAYVGFHSFSDSRLAPVATGNWGCGAFKGDPKLKFLIQLMACSAARRDMVYYTFHNAELKDTIYELQLFLATNKITICELWKLLCRFVTAQLKQEDFIPFLQQAFHDKFYQPSIKKFFPPIVKETSKNQPTSSKSNDSISSAMSKKSNSPEKMSLSQEFVIDSDTEIIESSQDVEVISVLKKPLVSEKKPKRESLGSSVLDLIDCIDGNKRIATKEDKELIPSLLSSIDKICKNSKLSNEQKTAKDDVCIEMEVDVSATYTKNY